MTKDLKETAYQLGLTDETAQIAIELGARALAFGINGDDMSKLRYDRLVEGAKKEMEESR